MTMHKILFTKDPIDINDIISYCGTGSDGAIVTFIGRARDNSDGRRVTGLEYEIYEDMAIKELEKIVSKAMDMRPVTNVMVVHRYGSVNIGESSIIIGVSSPHRDEAFQTARYIIDNIKKSVTVWKKELYEDGSCWISEGPQAHS
jgi:molybdopterin synthase catalytic subunit